LYISDQTLLAIISYRMNRIWILFLVLAAFSCTEEKDKNEKNDTFVIAFGSCDNQELENVLWREISKNDPDLFIWGGDIIYGDGTDIKGMQKSYLKQKNDTAYQNFIKDISVLGTWDDHDYGINDGGKEFGNKDSVQQHFLDFFDIDPKDARRTQKGVYHSEKFVFGENSINIILLDTRYFRTALTKDTTGSKRYVPNDYGDGTILGKTQWEWLEKELNSSKSDFNIIVSSIQVLSKEHGFESWGNMPHETDKMKEIISNSRAKGVIILSGDRHIAEISMDSIKNLNYPLIDFTSSGLTHSYTSFSGEPNIYRITEVVSDLNFGILKIDFKTNSVSMEILGRNNLLLQNINRKY
jgi:alkaline phosphatase D